MTWKSKRNNKQKTKAFRITILVPDMSTGPDLPSYQNITKVFEVMERRRLYYPMIQVRITKKLR